MVKREILEICKGLRVNAACTTASPANNYTKDVVLCIYNVFKSKMPIPNPNT